MDKFLTWVERTAERVLTKRKIKRATLRSKPRTILSEIWSWIDALIFAIFWVIIINQYLFQLFVIPSPSMVPTLLVGDRVVVNKDAYGVELYPAGKKVLTKNRRVQRDDIITFYNPEYDSRGPVFDVLSQVVYMGTLTLVNIDKNEDGTPRERLYVKRAVGMPGDIITFKRGNVLLELSGTDSKASESEIRERYGLSLGPNRSVEEKYYSGLEAAAIMTAYQNNGIKNLPSGVLESYRSISGTDYDYIFDRYGFEGTRTAAEAKIDPSNMKARGEAARYENGIYVPKDNILPLGDNRDNSNDGRYFGPVKENTINGQVIARFWPLNRIGSLIGK